MQYAVFHVLVMVVTKYRKMLFGHHAVFHALVVVVTRYQKILKDIKRYSSIVSRDDVCQDPYEEI